MVLSFLKKQHKADVKPEEEKRRQQNPKILEVNLIKDEARISFDWNKNIFTLVLTLFVTSLFVAEIYFGLNWWKAQEEEKARVIEENIVKVNVETSQIKAKIAPALTYKEKAAAISDLLDNHIYWSNFFVWMEKNTLSTVSYDGFSGDLSGNYSLAAKAKSFADVSWQAKAFLNDPAVKKLSIISADSSIGKEKGKVGEINFIMNLGVKPTIFKN